MQRKSSKEEYLRRVNLVVEYINNHLDGELELAKLAELSCLSPYHFHRIMRAFLGEPLGSYVSRIRVETAARLLRYSNLSVQEIADNVGYDTPSSLTKVFKQYYNISPTEYRNNKTYTIMRPLLLSEELNLKSPKITELEAKQAIYIRLTGAYNELDFPGTWGRLWNFVKEHKLFSAGIEHIGIYHDDPKVTESDKLRSDVCLVIRKPVTPQGEIGVKEIPGGKYAVFLYQGSYDKLGFVYDTIFAKWLPESGCELRNVPMFEKYVNNPAHTTPDKLKTEIYIPVK